MSSSPSYHLVLIVTPKGPSWSEAHDVARELGETLAELEGIKVAVHQMPGGPPAKPWPDEGEDDIQHLQGPEWLVYLGIALQAGPAVDWYINAIRSAIQWLRKKKAVSGDPVGRVTVRLISKHGTINVDLGSEDFETIRVTTKDKLAVEISRPARDWRGDRDSRKV